MQVGVFLGVNPAVGGLFVYAETVLEALRQIQKNGAIVRVAYVDEAWADVLSAYSFEKTRIDNGEWGLRLATLFLRGLLPAPLTRWLAWRLNPIPKQLARLRCDLWVFPAQDTLSYQVPFEVIGTIHDLMHRYERSFPEVSQNGRWWAREHRFRNIASWAKAVLVDSEIGRQHVIESYGTDPKKIHALPYVAPSYIYLPERPDFCRRYALPKKFIFYPARFLKHKNHIRLITAASSIRARVPDIALVFTESEGPGCNEAREHASGLGFLERITFLDHVPPEDLGGIYRRARAMVMPSFFGPTNLPPLESFVCRCPVAVSNVYGMPQQVGNAALLFDPNSTDQMADVLEKLWTDDLLCERLVAEGTKNIERWNANDFAESFDAILTQVSASLGAVGQAR